MIDFQQLYEHVPVPLMVLDRQLKYVAANRAYLEITASTFEALAGRCIFDVFPDDPSDPGRAGAQMLRNSLQHVLATGQPDTLALIPYRVPQRTAQRNKGARDNYQKVQTKKCEQKSANKGARDNYQRKRGRVHFFC